MATNLDLARFGAHVMDVLSHYDHLPPLEFVIVNEQAKRVTVSLAHRTDEEQARGVAGWVAAFQRDPRNPLITLDQMVGRLKALVTVQDVTLRFDEVVNLTFADELAKAMNFRVAVTADQLLSGLDRLAAVKDEVA